MKNLKPLLTESGKITIAAIDHRGSLEKILDKEGLIDWKKEMIELYRDKVSGILIDPVYGKELIDTSQNCGWMMSMEKSGYRGGKEARATELLPGWSVRQAKELGVSGVKLLLYYDPENLELAKTQKQLAMKVAEECRQEDVVFLLEPLSYKIEGTREEEVLRIAEDLKDLDVDIFKFEYPDTRQACEKISKIIDKPWVLLSAGMKYEQYKESLRIACKSGASGMAVGRAVWQEFGDYQGEEREEFLRTTAVSRMRELISIVEKYGKSVE